MKRFYVVGALSCLALPPAWLPVPKAPDLQIETAALRAAPAPDK